MISRNSKERPISRDDQQPFSLTQLVERTRGILYPKQRHESARQQDEQQPLSAKELRLKKIHQNAQLLGIFISLDNQKKENNQAREALKTLLRKYATYNSVDEADVQALRKVTLLSLLDEEDQEIIQEWLTKRAIQMNNLFTRTIGEIADFLAQKSIDGSLKVQIPATMVTDDHHYLSRDKAPFYIFKNISEETIIKLTAAPSLRELYSRISASAHNLK